MRQSIRAAAVAVFLIVLMVGQVSADAPHLALAHLTRREPMGRITKPIAGPGTRRRPSSVTGTSTPS